MTEERIAKLRELAERGVGGEKDNAKAILTKLGIDWQKPKESFRARVYNAFGGDINQSWSLPFNELGDPMFAYMLLKRIANVDDISIAMNRSITFRCTKSQFIDIRNIYMKHKTQFSRSMLQECDKFIDSYLMNT